MRYFDSHAHYYDGRFDEECDEGVDNLIGALLKDCVSHIVNVGTSPDTCRLAIAQARRYGGMYTALGIHPTDACSLGISIDAALSDIESLIKDGGNKCVCLGEIGLDYYWEGDRALQMRYFEEQMRLAEHLKIPVSIHDREAHGDVMEVIRRHPEVRGVLHSYSGSVEMARELCDRGYMISFSGTLTFKNARKPKEVITSISPSHIMIETDCPYLAPHPMRGKLNHSGYLAYTNAQAAELLGMSESECAALTSDNAKRFFNIETY